MGKRAGYDVYVTERELNSRNKSRFDLLDVHGIAYETENSGRFFGLCSLAVISPGIDPRSEYIREVAAEMEIISEIEFAYMLMDDPYIIGITGTNGKSTTVSLIHEILCDQGVDSVLTGNIGTPLTEKTMERHEVYVCEL